MEGTMRILVPVIISLTIVMSLAGCIDGLFGDDDDDEADPYYPFEVTDEIRYLTPGGVHIMEANVKNIGDDKVCNVSCIVRAETITGRGIESAKISWLWPGSMQVLESVNEMEPDDEYAISAGFSESLEGLDFVYDFSWVECEEDDDDGGANLGGIVAPPRE
jgi:hypothetical protein